MSGLGRIPNVLDGRDWKVADHIDTAQVLATFTPGSIAAVDATLKTLHSSRVFHFAALLGWADAVTAYLHAGPSPTPTPVPVPTAVVWTDAAQLDQGSTPHCIGFGWAQRFNTLEAADPDAATFAGYVNADGDAIYYECKVIDGEPGQENGSQVRSGAKAMQARGKLANYAFAASVDEIKAWLLAKGPVVVGTDWLTGMDSPDAAGLVTVGGSVRGGHCYVADAYDPNTDLIRFQNSWGTWGLNGYFYAKASDWAKIGPGRGGDACVTIES